jgi:hypothetical protein
LTLTKRGKGVRIRMWGKMRMKKNEHNVNEESKKKRRRKK